MTTVSDLTFLRKFTNNDSERIKKYIGMFLQQTPAMIQQIESSYKEKDWTKLKTSAHSLKPQISYMGIKSAESIIQTIEANSIAGKDEGTAEQINKLKSILESVYPELRNEIGI